MPLPAQTAAETHPAPGADAATLARAERDARLAAWVAEAAEGSATAFEAFYDSSFPLARALARRMLRSADVEDLLADAYFEAWRHAARFDATRGSAVTWLLTIVRSRAVDLLRRQATHPSIQLDDDDEAADHADDFTDPADRLWRVQAGGRLEAALRELNAAERWVLGLAYFRELPHAAIAHATGLPLGTVKSLILRSQAKLRSRLAG